MQSLLFTDFPKLREKDVPGYSRQNPITLLNLQPELGDETYA